MCVWAKGETEWHAGRVDGEKRVSAAECETDVRRNEFECGPVAFTPPARGIVYVCVFDSNGRNTYMYTLSLCL